MQTVQYALRMTPGASVGAAFACGLRGGAVKVLCDDNIQPACKTGRETRRILLQRIDWGLMDTPVNSHRRLRSPECLLVIVRGKSACQVRP